MSSKMRAALQQANTPAGLGSWDYASGVLGGIKKRGWVTRGEDGQYRITPAGQDALVAEIGR